MKHGRHLKAMGKGASSLLGDVDRVRTFLESLVPALGMRALADPVMFDVPIELEKMRVEPFEDEGGVTGTIVLSTSHVAIHTWPARHFFVIDVFSCRDFDPSIVARAVLLAFGAFKVKLVDVDVDYDDGD